MLPVLFTIFHAFCSQKLKNTGTGTDFDILSFTPRFLSVSICIVKNQSFLKIQVQSKNWLK
jgi:hypothetical protein